MPPWTLVVHHELEPGGLGAADGKFSRGDPGLNPGHFEKDIPILGRFLRGIVLYAYAIVSV